MVQRKRPRSFSIGTLIAVLVVGGAAYLYWVGQSEPERPEALTVPSAPVAEQPVEPRYPVPEARAAAPLASGAGTPETAPDDMAPRPAQALPPLNTSTPTLTQVITELFGAERIYDLFHMDEIARRFVATVDNLPRAKLGRKQFLVKPASGPFRVEVLDEGFRIAPDNAARYAPYVNLLTAVDTDQLVALYVQFYPLFQEAYVELGYPQGYFNDRLVEVLDHLLATPELDQPPQLVRPHVFYEYADPELEALSGGQKILLRMNREQAAIVKQRLSALRAALTDLQ